MLLMASVGHDTTRSGGLFVEIRCDIEAFPVYHTTIGFVAAEGRLMHPAFTQSIKECV